jgi:hypothetical protein
MGVHLMGVYLLRGQSRVSHRGVLNKSKEESKEDGVARYQKDNLCAKPKRPVFVTVPYGRASRASNRRASHGYASHGRVRHRNTS